MTRTMATTPQDHAPAAFETEAPHVALRLFISKYHLVSRHRCLISHTTQPTAYRSASFDQYQLEPCVSTMSSLCISYHVTATNWIYAILTDRFLYTHVLSRDKIITEACA